MMPNSQTNQWGTCLCMPAVVTKVSLTQRDYLLRLIASITHALTFTHFSMSVNSLAPPFTRGAVCSCLKCILTVIANCSCMAWCFIAATVDDFAAEQRQLVCPWPKRQKLVEPRKCLCSTCLILNFLSDRTARHS